MATRTNRAPWTYGVQATRSEPIVKPVRFRWYVCCGWGELHEGDRGDVGGYELYAAGGKSIVTLCGRCAMRMVATIMELEVQ